MCCRAKQWRSDIEDAVRMGDSNPIADLLRSHADELRIRFGVHRLMLFGSAYRGEMRPDSDVDLLVEFDGPATFDRYMDLKFHVESLLGRPVDLVTPSALRPAWRPAIEKESLRVA